MAVTPIAPGHPDYSSTGTSKWIPQIWSTKLIGKFYKSTVFADITNTDYEGEIKNRGDKVIIRTTPEISIFDYQKGMDLTYSTYESAPTELVIDKGKYFAFPCDDVDRKQADINYINAWSEDAALRMKIAIDREILANMYTGVHSKNAGTTAGLVSSAFNRRLLSTRPTSSTTSLIRVLSLLSRTSPRRASSLLSRLGWRTSSRRAT
jgi:hypothetical protein